MESMLWSAPAVWRRFGFGSQRDADVVRPMAYSQGFYNLFLAGGSVVGLVLYWTTLRQVGFGLVFFCGVCMVLASLVLVTTGRRFWAAALLQGALPLVGLVLFVIAENS
jgi:putative membrane protein